MFLSSHEISLPPSICVYVRQIDVDDADHCCVQVTVGVAYKDMDRSSAEDSARLGHNTHSWSLYWSGKAFSLWHAGKETALAGPKARRVGVYVDQQAGVLAFYRVSHTQAQEICCVHTHFHGPLFASFRFWSGVGSSVTICELN